MSTWRRLVFGVYVTNNPCCIQFIVYVYFWYFSYLTSNLKISSKNSNQYITRESHWYLHSWTWWIEYDKQCPIDINSNGGTAYKHHVRTTKTTVAGREKGLIIFENYSIPKKMVGGIGMH
jgi:hypothetical protein